MNWYKAAKSSKFSAKSLVEIRPKIVDHEQDTRLRTLRGICEYLRLNLASKWEGKITPETIKSEREDANNSPSGTIIVYVNQMDIEDDQIPIFVQDVYRLLSGLHLQISQPIPEYNSPGFSTTYKFIQLVKIEIYQNDYIQPAFYWAQRTFGKPLPSGMPWSAFVDHSRWFTIRRILGIPEPGNKYYPSYNAKFIQQKLSDPAVWAKIESPNRIDDKLSISNEIIKGAINEILSVVNWCVDNDIEEIELS